MERNRTVFTYEDFKRLPEDTHGWEVLEGELVHEPSPRPFHQIVAGNLFALLQPFALEHRLGHVIAAVDVVLSETNVLEPDLVFIPKERVGIITEVNVRGAPALVVEVLSPTTTRRDRDVKRKIYERFGVQEYWIVDPQARTVEVMTLNEEGYVSRGVLAQGHVLTSPLFPGLSLEVSGVFHDPFSYR